jgi:hypothetical protein
VSNRQRQVVTPVVAQCQGDSWIPTLEGAPFKLCLSGDFLLARPQATVSNIAVRFGPRGGQCDSILADLTRPGV